MPDEPTTEPVATLSAPVSPAPEESDLPNAPDGFAASWWKGRPNYQCSQCRWSTLDWGTALEHPQVHLPQPAARRAERFTGLLDASGSPLVVPAEEPAPVPAAPKPATQPTPNRRR